MKAETFTPENVKVFADGVLTKAEISAEDAYTMRIDLDKTYFDSKIRVELSENIENIKNVSLMQAETINLVSPSAIEVKEYKITDDSGTEITSLEGNEKAKVNVTLANNMTDKSENAVVLMLLLDKNNTVTGCSEARITIAPAEEKNIVCAIETSGGKKLSVFLWQDYNLMKPWLLKQSIN